MLKKIIAVTLGLFLISCCIVNAAGENIAFTGEKNAGEMFSIFGTGTASVAYITNKKGEKEAAVKTTGLGENTWSSPCVDIFSIIKNDVAKNGAGRYAISFNVMLEGEENKNYDLAVLVRASKKTILFNDGNGGAAGYRTKVGIVKAVTGKWKSFSTTFGVSEEDVQGEETWKLCLDSLPKELHTVWLNDFSIIRVSDDSTPEVKNAMCVDCTKFSGKSTETTPITEGENLLDKATSSFENVANWQDTKWTSFSAGKMSIIEEGYSGSCLKMETPENTWGSPALEIFPYITEAGQYTISMFVKYECEINRKVSLILRGTRKNSFIEQHNKNFYGDIGTKTFKAGQWEKFTSTITVTEEDLVENDSWRLCFSSTQPDVKAVYIDEIVLIKGTVKGLPQNPTPNESVQLEQQEQKEKQEVILYDENIGKTAVKTAVVTFVIVAIVVPLKIFLPKVFKKGAKK